MRYIVSDDLGPEKIRQLLNHWQMNDRVKLQRKYDYYNGKQKILNKTYSDPSKPCNRVVTNYCRSIVSNFAGFNLGIPATYQVDDNVQYFLRYNDYIQKDTELLTQGLIFGVAYELLYIDSDGETRFENISPLYGFDIYSSDLSDDDMSAFVRIYTEDNVDITQSNTYMVVVYTKDKITTYKTVGEFGSLEFVSEVPHSFGQVPVVAFNLNPEREGIFEQIIPLQDSYNEVLSAQLDELGMLVDSFLVLKGVSAEKEDIQDMKTNRVLLMDADSSAEFLVKNVNNSQIIEILTEIKKRIIEISTCPNFSDENFATTSGIALQYRLTGFRNTSLAFMAQFEKALRRRIELFGWIEQIKGDKVTDFKITFTNNLPTNTLEIAQIVNQLRGLVSDETLLSQIPFVDDAEEELKKTQAEKQENMKLYDFGAGNSEDGADNDLLGKENNNSD